jgi:enoyl-CoA hydratase/carnithine racemase
MEPVVTRRVEEGISFIALNRPDKRNAVDDAVLAGLAEQFLAAEADPETNAIVLHGEGRGFSAGIDFQSFLGSSAEGLAHPTRLRSFVSRAQGVLNTIERIEKPVIGALHRFVIGLGLEIALACDLRVAAEDCELSLPETRIGLIPDVGGTTRLTRVVGYARAKEMILTARVVPAAEAERMGLVNAVASAGEHLAAAKRLAGEIGKNAPLAVGLAKKIIDRGHGLDKMTFMELEALAQSILVRTEDFIEGATALAERREPRFKGR